MNESALNQNCYDLINFNLTGSTEATLVEDSTSAGQKVKVYVGEEEIVILVDEITVASTEDVTTTTSASTTLNAAVEETVDGN